MMKIFSNLINKIFKDEEKEEESNSLDKFTSYERIRITCYKMDLSFSRMIPNKNYNGMRASKDVIEAAKKNVVSTRKYFKNKHGIDIHLELYGKKSKAMPWENSE